MTRRAAHVDGNHAAVVAALRQAGIGVLSLAGIAVLSWVGHQRESVLCE